MKVFGFSLLMSFFFASANASTCFDVVQKQYQETLERDGYTFDGFDLITQDEVVEKINISSEIEDTEATLQSIKSKDVILFVGYSSQYAGSAEEILVVDLKTCGIKSRFYTYVE